MKNDDETKLKQEVVEALTWAIRSIEFGNTVEDTMTGMIFRLQAGEEWSRNPVIEYEPVEEDKPSLDCCKVCGVYFDSALSVQAMMEVQEARANNGAVFPVRVCTDCYNQMDIRSPYKASMN
jgi:hypothetical protein|tara:strand:- start:110 stop:475 length:366 start_codon:yes stop_codon:yes gene_type:complete